MSRPRARPLLSTLEGMIGAVGTAPAVPVTLAPDPATLGHLADSGHSHTVAEVATLAGSSVRQTLAGPFVPVDAGALVAGGLAGELGAQVRRGSAVLASAAVGVHATKGTWVTTTPLDQAAVNELAPDYRQFVVPPGSVSGPTGPLTVTQPFTLSPGARDGVARPRDGATDGDGVRRRARRPPGGGEGVGCGARRRPAVGRGVAHLLRSAQSPRPGGQACAPGRGGGGAGGVGPRSHLPLRPAGGPRGRPHHPSGHARPALRAGPSGRRQRSHGAPRRDHPVDVGAVPAAPCARRGGPARPASPARWRATGGGDRRGPVHRRPPPGGGVEPVVDPETAGGVGRVRGRPQRPAAGPVGPLRHHPAHRRHRQRAHHAAAQHVVSGDGGGAAHERQAPVPHGRPPVPGPSARPRRCRARRGGRASRRCAPSITPPTPSTSTCRRGPRATSRST